ncbi:hypothetical protein [Methylomonas albis]|nr:hypothetical protein [Methylomonas albis]
MTCYTECDCCCSAEGHEFDEIISEETLIEVSAKDLAHSNLGWFCGFDDLKNGAWPISENDGVYLLWEKNDYCPKHDRFHARALYVGKGFVKKRIFDHAKNKGFTEDNIVYFTFIDIANRKAKYVEQLLLDLYDFPLNKAENLGTGRFCGYITQSEADLGFSN